MRIVSPTQIRHLNNQLKINIRHYTYMPPCCVLHKLHYLDKQARPAKQAKQSKQRKQTHQATQIKQIKQRKQATVPHIVGSQCRPRLQAPRLQTPRLQAPRLQTPECGLPDCSLTALYIYIACKFTYLHVCKLLHCNFACLYCLHFAYLHFLTCDVYKFCILLFSKFALLHV